MPISSNKVSRKGLNLNILQLFIKLLPVQIFLVITSGISDTVNGLLIGNCLKSSSMVALCMSAPLSAFLGSVASIISSGAGILCGQYMGRGETDKVEKVFSVSVIMSFVSGSILTVLCFLFATPIAQLLGAKGELIAETATYIRGTSFGILPLLMIPCLMSFLQMCNRSMISLLATILLAVFNTLFGLLNANVFHGGLFGFALVGSLSKILSVAFIIFYFLSHRDMIRFNPKTFDFNTAKEILIIGSPSSLAGILYSIRNVFINSSASAIGGNPAVNALGILGSCDVFFDCFNVGVGNSLTMLASVFIGERDSRSLKELMKIAFAIGMAFCAMKLIVAKLFGADIAMLFGAQGEAVDFGKQLLFYYCLCAPFNILTLIFMGTYQSLGRAAYCNLLYPVNCIITPFICCMFLAKAIGIRGVWMCYMLAEIVTLICMFIYASNKKKGIVKNVDDMLFLDHNFDTENKLTFSIDQIEEVVDVSRKIQDFCKENGIDKKRAMLSGLCMEEMAGNIVEHGFTKDNKNHLIDVFACVENNEVLLRLRDNCIPFDPHSRLEMYDKKDPAKNIGIRMVSRIAREMNYQTTFGMNVLSIRL